MISVSTIIPVHTYSSVVKKAITSAVNQDYENNTVNIIVNSRENDVINRIEQDFKQTVNLVSIDTFGVSYARNEGIRVSNSDYIAFLDSDDFWFEDKLTNQLNYMTENKYNVCGSLMNYVTESNDSNITVGSLNFTQNEISEAKFMPFPVSSLILREDCIKKIGLFSEALGTIEYGQIEDIEYISRLAYKYEVGIFPSSTGQYLINSKGVTANKLLTQRSAAHMLSRVRKNGTKGKIKAFDYKMIKNRTIYHELFRLKMIESYIDKHLIRSLVYLELSIILKPILTIKKIYSKLI